jgi:hypothetical protein
MSGLPMEGIASAAGMLPRPERVPAMAFLDLTVTPTSPSSRAMRPPPRRPRPWPRAATSRLQAGTTCTWTR